MKNVYIIVCVSALTIGIPGCATHVNSTSLPMEPIVTITDKQTLIEEIEKIIVSAKHEIEQKKWQEANAHLKNGINTLGGWYYNPRTIDDSGTKLGIADDCERKGLLENAALIRLRMLQGRLNLFKINP